MRKLLIVAITLALSGPLWAETASSTLDLVALGTYTFPKNDDVYDHAAGAEVQARFWLTDVVGLALAGGWSRWDVNDQNAVVGDGKILTASDISGDIDTVPVGASVLLRVMDTERLTLVLEGGARYVFTDDSGSDVRIIVTEPGRPTATSTHRLKIDDGVVAVAAAQLELKLTPNVFLLAGGGYQWDLDKGDVKFLDEKVSNNKFESALVQAGLGVSF